MKTKLPGAIIIGAQRCGTTRFFNLLNRHPQIAFGKKEIHFYDLRFNRGLDWYYSVLPPCEEGEISIEGSPYYIYHPLCAERIFKCQPGVKIIALVRNPVDRAYSNYHHELRGKWENLSFREALLAEPGRTEGTEERIIRDNGMFCSDHNHYSYLQRSAYYSQLMRYYNLFDHDNIMVIRSEDFYEDEQKVLLETHEFLGLEPVKQEVGAFGGIKEYPPLDVDLREKLVKFFRPHNVQLEEFLKRDFGWDK